MQKTQPPRVVDGNRVKRQLTPLEQIQRLDEAFQHALSVKKKTLLEMYGNDALDRSNNNSKKPILVMGTPVEARDLALAAIVQAHCLLEAVYEGTKLEEPPIENNRKPSHGSLPGQRSHTGQPGSAPKAPPQSKPAGPASTGSPRKISNTSKTGTPPRSPKKAPTHKPDMVPGVPCSQLACIAAPLMKYLTALSQSCTTLERELKQKTKELEDLKAKVETPKDPQRPVNRPSDLPLQRRHEVSAAGAQKQVVDVLRRSCLLSASPTPAPGGLAVKTDVMSRSLPSGFANDGKAEDEKDMDEEHRRKKSLQRRWRHIGAAASGTEGKDGGSDKKSSS